MELCRPRSQESWHIFGTRSKSDVDDASIGERRCGGRGRARELKLSEVSRKKIDERRYDDDDDERNSVEALVENTGDG